MTITTHITKVVEWIRKGKVDKVKVIGVELLRAFSAWWQKHT